MLKFLINLFKISKKKLETTMPKRYHKKELTFSYVDQEGEVITKTIKNVTITIKETRYGKTCNVICREDLTQNEVMAIIRIFL